MSSFCRMVMPVILVPIWFMFVTGCDSAQKPVSGDECVTSYDCPDGLVCEDGYCIDGNGDDGSSITEKEASVYDDGTALPEKDPGVFPDGTDTVLPDDGVTDDGTIEPEADELFGDDTVELGDDTTDVTDDAAEVMDDAVVVADDTAVAVDDMVEVFDDMVEIIDDMLVVDEDITIVDDQPVVDEDTVDVTPPTVVGTSPADTAVDVAPGALITITFSEELDPATVDTLTVVLVQNGSASVDVALDYDNKDFTVTLDPTTDLVYGASYTVTVMTAITDLAGNALATEYVFTFTVTACGNGSPDGAEICDDGAINGTYDHCNIFCSGQGSHCGDGAIDLPQELCDTGTTIACDQIAGESYVNTLQVPCNGTCDGWVTTNCTCAAGYTKDGNEDCVDIDECTVNSNPCDNNSDAGGQCNNTAGGYTCTCSDGFQFLGGGCRNINECLTLTNPCDNDGDLNALCSDMTPGYTCVCGGGFEFANGSCIDIDECAGNPCDESGDVGATCNNLNGDFTCNCSAGYQDNGSTCEEINECDGNPCDVDGDAAATCTDQVNGYLCSCSLGFNYADGSCKDVNECDTLTNPCDDQNDSGALCVNQTGDYSCDCSDGFAAGAGTCQDINECLTNNGDCDPLTECANTTGSRTCTDCPSGYTGNGADPAGCVNIDECTTLTNPCNDSGDGGATCADTDGGYTCTCSGGYYDNGTTCVEIDDCYNNPCDNNGDGGATCADIGVGYTCTCSAGWESNGTVCADIDECTLSNPCNDLGDNSAVCTNSAGSYSCACSTGFTAGGGTCIDNDECTALNNPCNDNGDGVATCTNTPGTYTCGCSTGFTFATGSCLDVNECDTNNGGCDLLTACANTIGGRTCGSCPAGYTGDGYVGCTDIDECAGNPCDDNGNAAATCTNSPGSFTCNCTSGFRFSIGSCFDINECTENSDNCHPTLANCTNTTGSFTCACIPPATGNGVTCTSCGDAVINGSETCDEGSALNGTYGHCNATCTGLGERCGDSITNGPEQCDDGNATNADACKNNCQTNVCGDGVMGGTIPAFVEGFESGSNPSYSANGSPGWNTSTAQKHAGSYALRNADIGDDETAQIYMGKYTQGTICFWYAGQSESGYDYFTVYADGSQVFQTSGSHGWTQQCITVSAGYPTILFEYSKDSSGSTGWDAYYIDDVQFHGAMTEICESGQTTNCTAFGYDVADTVNCGSDCTWAAGEAQCHNDDGCGC